jgi:hypothetical protein
VPEAGNEIATEPYATEAKEREAVKRHQGAAAWPACLASAVRPGEQHGDEGRTAWPVVCTTVEPLQPAMRPEQERTMTTRDVAEAVPTASPEEQATPGQRPEDAEDMQNYGITRVPIDYFHYREFRYTNLKDAIAQAKRDRDQR